MAHVGISSKSISLKIGCCQHSTCCNHQYHTVIQNHVQCHAIFKSSPTEHGIPPTLDRWQGQGFDEQLHSFLRSLSVTTNFNDFVGF